MADRASASIIIGGRLPADGLSELLSAIEADHGFAGWDEHPIDEAVCRGGTALEICGYDLAGGVFDEIETFAQARGLAYVRTSGSCPGAFGPERVVFDGAAPPRHYELNEDEAVVIDRRQLRALGRIEAAEAWFAAAEFTPPPLVIVGAPAAALAADAL